MPTPLTPLTAVPRRWQDRLRCALGALRTWQAMLESARDTERLFGSPGRYEWEVRSGRAQAAVRAQVTLAEATLAEFARLAQANGVDPEAVLVALGGRPAQDEEGPHVHEWRRP